MNFLVKIKETIVDKFETLQYHIESYGYWYALVTRPFNNYVVHPIERVVRIFQWIPTLWNDTDWNDRDILQILDYKLSRVRKALEDGYGEENWKKERFAEIDEVRGLLKTILEGEHVTTERAAHSEKYGDIGMHGVDTDQPHLKRCVFTYSKVDPSDEAKMEEASHESYKISELEEQREKEAYDRAFKLLAENCRKWWD